MGQRKDLAFLVGLILHFNGVFGYLAPIAPRLPVNGTPAAPGSPWPRPESLTENPEFATLSGRDFAFVGTAGWSCDILERAFLRYGPSLLFRDLDVEPAINTPVLTRVEVSILPNSGDNLCNEYPKLYTGEDRNYERYTISVTKTSDSEALATINASTVWGALHGIETFSQLIWKDLNGSHFYVNFTEIGDAPRFPHRGFMLDTARHYIDLPIIQSVLDGMAYNKLNVFHWHIVDDQSFPFVSRTFPELSGKGSFLPELTYEPEEVQAIINYARDRGIRVVLEFDTPGHTHGFGKGIPQILTPCYGAGPEGPPGTPNYGLRGHAAYEILDPTRNITFDVMREFFKEIKNVTKDEYIHLGMDEAYPYCWESSPVIQDFIAANNLNGTWGLQDYYAERHFNMTAELGFKTIIWEDPLDLNVRPPSNVVIEVWQGGNSDGTPSDAWVPILTHSLKLGYNSLLSSCWYLNYIRYPGAFSEEFRKNYECDPLIQLYNNVTEEEKKLVLGGEACYWGEYADGTNFLPRIFPLVSATAERLWSKEFPINTEITNDAWHRIDQQRCRMLWRGIPAQPVYGGYCFAQEKTGFRQPPVDKENSGFTTMASSTFTFTFVTSIISNYI